MLDVGKYSYLRESSNQPGFCRLKKMSFWFVTRLLSVTIASG